MRDRLWVEKTVKAYVAGKFIRSESGHTFRVLAGGDRPASASGTSAADTAAVFDVVNSSRKDARDALRPAVDAQRSWWSSSAYLRGQILYRLAEMTETRRDLDGLAVWLGLRPTVEAAVDLAVVFAGWPDKVGQVLGSVNAPAGFSCVTEPRPTGVTVVSHEATATLATMVRTGCAALAAGNAVIQVVNGPASVLAASFAEVLAVSDVPAGLWQILPSERLDPLVTLAGATDVRCLDVLDHPERVELERVAASSVTRCRSGRPSDSGVWASLEDLRWQMDYTTLWQPLGR